MHRRHAAWLVFVVALAGPSAALAQGPAATPTERSPAPEALDATAARALFDEARKDEQAGRWGEALMKFQRIARSKETASVRFHAAYCEEKMGEVASAYLDYERALELARSSQGPDRKLIIEQSADGLKELAPRVPELTIQLPRSVEGVRVLIDGTEVPAERATGPLRVNPGLHTLQVMAPGQRPFQREFSLRQREKHTVVVLFEATPSASPAAAPPTAAPAPAAAVVATERPASDAGGGSLAPWIVGGASLALAGVGVGFFFAGEARGDELDDCRSGRALCDESSVESSRKRNYAIAGTAGALSLVGAGVTVVLALSGGSSTSVAARAAGGLVIAPNAVGWAGRF
jgi:hypothetical protein